MLNNQAVKSTIYNISIISLMIVALIITIIPTVALLNHLTDPILTPNNNEEYEDPMDEYSYIVIPSPLKMEKNTK